MNYRTPITILIASLLLLACSKREINDTSMRTSGATLGQSTIHLMTEPVTAQSDTMRSRLKAVESELITLALRHNELSLSSALQHLQMPSHDTANDVINWDGERLQVQLHDQDQGDLLSGQLIYQGYRRETTLECWWGEETSDGSIQCPAMIEGSLHILKPEQALTIHADFNITLDGDECAAGGQVEISYTLRGEEGSEQSGQLTSSYNGCNRIRILEPNKTQ
jgi:hypothetical protein